MRPNDGHVMGDFVERWLGIRPCFRHQWVAFVGRMQYAPTRVTCHTSKYERVSRTGCTLRIEIRPCFSNGVHVIHRNTNVFPVPGAHYASKYGNVFRTGHALPIEIRPCFPNGAHVTHRNTDVFSESGEGVDEPEDGEEDDGGAYDAVQYADAANVEPSAET